MKELIEQKERELTETPEPNPTFSKTYMKAIKEDAVKALADFDDENYEALFMRFMFIIDAMSIATWGMAGRGADSNDKAVAKKATTALDKAHDAMKYVRALFTSLR